MSLTQALNSAAAGLRTTQTGLSVVSANVANAQTPGYIRKTIATQTTAAGADLVSVRVAGINRELDGYLQRQLRTEASSGSYADLTAQFYSRLQSVYGDPTSASGIQTVYNNFTTSLQALATSPSDYSARANVLSSAQALTGQLNGLTDSIQSLRSDAEQGLSDSVRSANDAMTRIAQLNSQLGQSYTNDSTRATLLDQRDAALDQLGQLVDIRTTENDAGQVSVYTGSGLQLVGNTASTLQFDARGSIDANAQWSADPNQRGVGTISLVNANGASLDLIQIGAFRSGQIASYIAIRDKVLPQAQTQLDQLAGSMAGLLSDQTTQGSAASAGSQSGFDLDLTNLKAGNAVTVNYTDTATGKTHTLKIVRVDDPKALPLSNDTTADPNDEVLGVDWSGGLSSVASQINSGLNGKLQASALSGATLRILNTASTLGTTIQSASATTTASGLSGGSAALPFFTDATSLYTGAVTGNGPQSLGFAGRITVNAALLNDPSKLVAYGPGVTTGDNTRASFIYDQLTSASTTYSAATGLGTKTSPFSGNLSAFLQQTLAQQGEAASNASRVSEGQDLVVNSLKQRFADGSAVNVDEEMSNLLKLQTAYGANARVFSTIKEVFDTLLRM